MSLLITPNKVPITLLTKSHDPPSLQVVNQSLRSQEVLIACGQNPEDPSRKSNVPNPALKGPLIKGHHHRQPSSAAACLPCPSMSPPRSSRSSSALAADVAPLPFVWVSHRRCWTVLALLGCRDTVDGQNPALPIIRNIP